MTKLSLTILVAALYVSAPVLGSDKEEVFSSVAISKGDIASVHQGNDGALNARRSTWDADWDGNPSYTYLIEVTPQGTQSRSKGEQHKIFDYSQRRWTPSAREADTQSESARRDHGSDMPDGYARMKIRAPIPGPINRPGRDSEPHVNVGTLSGYLSPEYQSPLAQEAYFKSASAQQNAVPKFTPINKVNVWGFNPTKKRTADQQQSNEPINQPGRASFIPVSVEQGANPTNRFFRQDDAREEILILFKEQR